MKKYWKQFVAWATGLTDDLFASARIRLAAFYLFITATILVIFSLVMYFSLVQIFKDSFGKEGPDLNDKGDMLVVRTIHDLKVDALELDIIALFVVSGLSYALAGKTLDPIRKAMEAQKEFSANASHELRTPLAVMKTECEVALKDHDLSPEAIRVISSNLEEVDRMSSMTEDLLKLSRLESEKEESFSSRINIADVIMSVVKRMDTIAAEKEVILKLGHLDQGAILGNRSYLETMIFNLVRNGINYNKPGGTVEINLVSYGKTVRMTIEDTGIGIGQEDLPHIFERFYKVDKSRTSGGTGVGLSIVEAIIGKHNGSIEVESKLGAGTKVIVDFLAA